MTTSGISAAGYVEHKSSVNFQSTVDRLVTAIEKAGMSVFASIDHAGGAKTVGMSMLPSVVLIYGQARGGTPVMQARGFNAGQSAAAVTSAISSRP